MLHSSDCHVSVQLTTMFIIQHQTVSFIAVSREIPAPHTSLFFSHSSSDDEFSRSVFFKFAKINIQRYFCVVFEVSKRFAVISQVETITVHIDKYV